MPSEVTIQFIAILVTVAGILTWLLKQVITFFIGTVTEKGKYIENLVSSNQTNTENFINTINHQRTLDRDMQDKTNQALRGLTDEISMTNQLNNRMLDIIYKRESK